MNELQVFNNEEFGQIRTITIENEPWFVGKDVCQAFGDTNYRRSLKRLDEEEKIISQVETAGGMQNVTFINESGLYSLIFYMQPQKAKGVSQNDNPIDERIAKLKKFKHWVTSEVLPEIRKTGTYSAQASDKHLDIMDRNARTRQANLLMKMATIDTLSNEYKNVLVSKASEILTGIQLIPLPKSSQKGYSATDIGNMFGVSAQRIGKISNANNLKTPEFGQWYHSKSEYSPKEVDTFVYNDRAVAEFKRILCD